MSLWLMEKVARKVLEREQAEVDRLAQNGALELNSITDEAEWLKEKTERLIAAFRKNREATQRGILKRVVFGNTDKRTEWYHDHYEADFVTELDNYLIKIGVDREPIHIESGTRTKPFGTIREVVEGVTLDVAWQAGYVTKREIQYPIPKPRKEDTERSGSVTHILKIGSQRIEPIEGASKPFRIWKTVSGVPSTPDPYPITHTQVVYDIDHRDGSVIPYIDGKVDDEPYEIEESPRMMAAGILQNAIEYVEQ
jgi:hypothetical protein